MGVPRLAASSPYEDYFRSVDGYRRINPRHLKGVIDPNYEVLATSLADLLDRDDSLYDHVVRKQVATTKPEEWKQLCDAAAWVILDRYSVAIRIGTWVPKL
jgi:hypothetical protein